MKNGLKRTKHKETVSEDDIHQWLQGADLSKLAKKSKFHRASFPRLQPTHWDKLYENFQKSKPISLRLPVVVLDKLKQISLQKGLGYQALIRSWITERISETTLSKVA